MSLREEIETAVNRNSAENGSATPDFILAQYLMDCLRAFDGAVMARERWYGRDKSQAATAGSGPVPVVKSDTPHVMRLMGDDPGAPPRELIYPATMPTDQKSLSCRWDGSDFIYTDVDGKEWRCHTAYVKSIQANTVEVRDGIVTVDMTYTVVTKDQKWPNRDCTCREDTRATCGEVPA